MESTPSLDKSFKGVDPRMALAKQTALFAVGPSLSLCGNFGQSSILFDHT